MTCKACEKINELLSDVPDKETILTLTFQRAANAEGSGVMLDYKAEKSFYDSTSPLALLHLMADTLYNLADQFNVPRDVAEGIVTGVYSPVLLAACIQVEVNAIHRVKG
jgi:hypothetical protein